MTDSQTFWEDWKSRIEFDLASFADPSSLIDVTRSGRSFRAKWTMRGQDREDLFSISRDRGVSVNIEGRNVQYHEFIAGPDMANLRQVAAMIVRASQLTPRLFVGTRAQREDAAGKTPGPALDVLTTLIHEELADATRVVMITGDAGAGKEEEGWGRDGAGGGACPGFGDAGPGMGGRQGSVGRRTRLRRDGAAAGGDRGAARAGRRAEGAAGMEPRAIGERQRPGGARAASLRGRRARALVPCASGHLRC